MASPATKSLLSFGGPCGEPEPERERELEREPLRPRLPEREREREREREPLRPWRGAGERELLRWRVWVDPGLLPSPGFELARCCDTHAGSTLLRPLPAWAGGSCGTISPSSGGEGGRSGPAWPMDSPDVPRPYIWRGCSTPRQLPPQSRSGGQHQNGRASSTFRKVPPPRAAAREGSLILRERAG